MILSRAQKQLILTILEKEQKSLFSSHKGKLLDQTVDDLSQMLRNEIINDPYDRETKT
ncbi:hypothetical protein [Ammoniphilus sp. YIM 78166]|uniref:hypothetical protein n=1 Tax=Ammoniphilus sp. YIM 78166 TaxID=1644106 RepID=UPI001430D225|nr:hypothetical protein [Ammoniphilus sp. YIM 78166]